MIGRAQVGLGLPTEVGDLLLPRYRKRLHRPRQCDLRSLSPVPDNLDHAPPKRGGLPPHSVDMPRGQRLHRRHHGPRRATGARGNLPQHEGATRCREGPRGEARRTPTAPPPSDGQGRAAWRSGRLSVATQRLTPQRWRRSSPTFRRQAEPRCAPSLPNLMPEACRPAGGADAGMSLACGTC